MSLAIARGLSAPELSVGTAGTVPPPPAGPTLQPPADLLSEQQAKPLVPKAPAVPEYSKPSAALEFSKNPSDEDLIVARCFEVRLAPQPGAAIPGENVALAGALLQFRKQRNDATPLEAFLVSYPNSRWRASLLLNLGLIYRHQSRFSKVIPLWAEAWRLTKEEKSDPMRAIADQALGELANIHARLGHIADLQKLVAETKGRDVRGPGKPLFLAAEEGLALMLKFPGEGYRCGPLALAQIYESTHPGLPPPRTVDDFKSTDRGTNLAQVHDWARKLNLEYQPAYRNPGADVIVPSVVHWKVGHFAALTAGQKDYYVSHDSTFGRDNAVSKEVLDAEASGYFLVPAGNLPAGWRPVSELEAKNIFGKGGAGNANPPLPVGYRTTTGGDGNNNNNNDSSNPPKPCPMTTYQFDATMATYILSDTPVGYVPPVGPEVRFQVVTDSNAYAAETTSNVGTGWNFNWLSYVQVLPAGTAYGIDVLVSGPGGGSLDFTGYNSTTGTYNQQPISRDMLVQVSRSNFVLTHQDGSKELFTLSDGNGNVYRTSSVDRFGNALKFGYDGNYRLVTVTDAIGQVTVLSYGLTTNAANADFFRVTSVTDPFGRSATFTYNKGVLTSITDILGLVSSFNTTSSPATLTTPYGTTTFAAYGNTGPNGISTIGIEATDPLGGQEKMEWDLAVEPTAISDIATLEPYYSAASNVVPAGFTNEYLVYRNTFFWSKKAMMVAPSDYSSAFLYHWLHDSADGNTTTGFVIESTKAPLENRVWRAYPGQTGPTYFMGTINSPSRVARILDDGTEQDYRKQYNSLSNVTQTIDPLGRTTNYNYAANQIDVQQVYTQNGSNQDLIASATYNAQHLPLTVTDASGQTTTYTYNSFGEVLTVTDPKNETTTFAYDSNGYLQGISGPIAGTTTTFGYDGFGRVRTVTDSEGYTITVDYDAADRPVRVTFPDGTYTQEIYNRLDPEWTRDRLGRWTLTQYDALRHLVLVEDPLQRKTLFEYCPCGALIAITDPNGHRTTFNRDLQERLTQKIYADGTSVNLAYEKTTSRLKGRTDANGQTKNYSYNLDNSVAEVSYANSLVATANVAYNYDPVYARITAMTDGVGTTTYAYNPITSNPSLGAGRLASVTGPLPNSTISYTYDQLGRILTKSINGAANTSSVAYDALGRATSVTNPLGQFAYQYVDETSRLSTIGYPNGQTTNFSYYPNASTDGSGNGDQRIQAIQNLNSSGANVSSFNYTYDPTGEITSWGKQWDSGAVLPSAFSYDAAGQLYTAIVPNPTTLATQAFFYSYDSSGNRTQEQIDSTINSSAFNSTNQYTSESAGGTMNFAGSVSEPATVTVGGNPAIVDSSNDWLGAATVTPGQDVVPVTATDSQGNSTSKSIYVTVTGGPNRTLTYDSNGNLVNNGAGQSYRWDAENRLVSITQTTGVTGFVYDGLGHRVQETLGGSVIKQWVWCGDQPCEERDANGNVTKRFYVLGEQIGGTPYFFTRDHLGSVREMTDGNGAIRARYDYDPFGRMTKISGDLDADFGFAGDLYHQATNLNLTLFRAYDPNLGRWLNRDPLGERGGLNLYGYAGNNPICFVDPFGLVWYNPASWAPIVAVGNAVGDFYSKYLDIPNQQENYDRNQYNFALPEENMIAAYNQQPNTPDFWTQLGDVPSQCHQEGTQPSQGNNKYVSPNGHYEAVYDASNNLITSGPNIGTYNFYNADSDPVAHFTNDVLPWIEYGASPSDPQGWGAVGHRAYTFLLGPPNSH
jgi:RHS repeat-associated protein